MERGGKVLSSEGVGRDGCHRGEQGFEGVKSERPLGVTVRMNVCVCACCAGSHM